MPDRNPPSMTAAWTAPQDHPPSPVTVEIGAPYRTTPLTQGEEPSEATGVVQVALRVERTWALKWPSQISDLGLTTDEVDGVEKIIQFVREHYLFSSTGRDDGSFEMPPGSISIGSSVVNLPVRLVVRTGHSLVDLHGREGLRPPTEMPAAGRRWAYNPDAGAWCLGKTVHTKAQELLTQWLVRTPRDPAEAFAEVVHCASRSSRAVCYERFYPTDLASLYSPTGLGDRHLLTSEGLGALLSAVQVVHSLEYEPAWLRQRDSGAVYMSDRRAPSLFCHALPECIVCDPVCDAPNEYRLKFSHRAFALQSVCTEPGWASPATLQLQGFDVDTLSNYSDLHGRKEDMWILALLVGSLLRGGFSYLPGSERPLPKFSFIMDRLKLDPQGHIDASGLAEVTQEHIHRELKQVMEQAQRSYEGAGLLEVLDWWKQIEGWLTLDRDESSTAPVTPSYSPRPPERGRLGEMVPWEMTMRPHPGLPYMGYDVPVGVPIAQLQPYDPTKTIPEQGLPHDRRYSYQAYDPRRPTTMPLPNSSARTHPFYPNGR